MAVNSLIIIVLFLYKEVHKQTRSGPWRGFAGVKSFAITVLNLCQEGHKQARSGPGWFLLNFDVKIDWQPF